MRDLLKTYKKIALSRSDFIELNNTKTRKENVIDSQRKELQSSGMLDRYNYTM
jgi:hypothetical protein